MKIINLTQHKSTPEQGVEDVKITGECVASTFGLRTDQFGYYPTMASLLTFESVPNYGQMWNRACLLTSIAVHLGATSAMIGGAGFFIPVLEKALMQRGITPLHAFSKRESVETVVDGKVTKTSIFRHAGFVQSGVDYAGDRDYGNTYPFDTD